MPTVRQATIDLLRQHGLKTWFGNPGSSELTLLDDFPSDFRSVGVASNDYVSLGGPPTLPRNQHLFAPERVQVPRSR